MRGGAAGSCGVGEVVTRQFTFTSDFTLTPISRLARSAHASRELFHSECRFGKAWAALGAGIYLLTPSILRVL